MLQKKEAKSWMIRIFVGVLVGTGAVLPGVSGGAMAAAFGLYRPMMEFFANPVKTWRKHIGLLLPVGIGLAIGFVALAGIVEWLLSVSKVPVIAFFLGCIFATMPSLFKEADRKTWKRLHWGAFFATAVIAAAFLSVFEIMSGGAVNLTPIPGSFSALITWTICGLIFALGSIVPGMSPSQLLLYAGVYEPMLGGIKSLNMAVCLPVMLGALISILLFTKAVTWLFSKGSRTMYAIIIGVVVASTLMIIPRQWPGTATFFMSAVCFAAGMVLIYFTSKLEVYKD